VHLYNIKKKKKEKREMIQVADVNAAHIDNYLVYSLLLSSFLSLASSFLSMPLTDSEENRTVKSLHFPSLG